MRMLRLQTFLLVSALVLPFVLPLHPSATLAAETIDREVTAPAAAGSQFIIRLRPSRPERTATEEEKAKIVRHFEYLKELLSQGKLILAGMALDDYAGIVIIRAEDRLDAERIMAGDPAVGGNVFLAELHPFTVTLMTGGK
jgi:uncharacterized protein YciI